MNKKQKVMIAVASVSIILVVVLLIGGFGKNDDQNWQIVQHLNGSIVVRDNAGVYPRLFATVYTYPRNTEYFYNDVVGDGDKALESVAVTFNDGGTAQISTYIRVATPMDETARKEFHRQFAGNMKNVKASVKSYMIDCLKSSAPLMSASEHQSARKAEFKQVVEGQLSSGIYKMRKVEKELKDRTDETGNPITVSATEIISNTDGMPIISSPSTLTDNYKLKITQFSVTGTQYDDETRAQFAAKKTSFLKAEQSKAQREEMVQERLKIVEEGLKNVAEAKAIGDVVKEKAVIAAMQKAEVALQTKIEAETRANQSLSVAEIEKQEALTVASKEFEVATIRAQAATKEAEAIVTLATAKEKQILLAGAITEKEQILAEISAKMKVDIAGNVSKMQVPTYVISGGSSNGEGASGNMQDTMMSLFMLKVLTGEDGFSLNTTPNSSK